MASPEQIRDPGRLTDMRRTTLRSLAPCLLILAACTASVSATVPVSGSLVRSGGPVAPGGTPQFYEVGVQLTFRSLTSSSTVKVTTGRLGTFSLRLVPGRYRVTIDGPGADTFGDGKPFQPFPNIVSVGRGQKNRFMLVISVP